MSQLRVSWKIDNFIAPGTPLTGVLLSYMWEVSQRGTAQHQVYKKKGPFEFWVERSQDKYTPQFNLYVESRVPIKHMTIQADHISDKGTLLSRTTLSFSDLTVTDLQRVVRGERLTELLSFESQAISTSPYGK